VPVPVQDDLLASGVRYDGYRRFVDEFDSDAARRVFHAANRINPRKKLKVPFYLALLKFHDRNDIGFARRFAYLPEECRRTTPEPRRWGLLELDLEERKLILRLVMQPADATPQGLSSQIGGNRKGQQESDSDEDNSAQVEVTFRAD
jgi:hypothetical protein